MKKESLDLINGAIGPLLLKMSAPSIAAMLVLSMYSFIDIFWISRVGPDAIAALTATFPIQMIIGAIGIGAATGVGSFSARMFGSGEKDQADKAAGQGFLLAFALGLISVLAGVLFPAALLKLFGAADQVLELSREYLVIYVVSAPLMFFVIIATNLFRSEGKPKLSMYIIVASGLIGAILDPFLILGWGPLPALGVSGAALSFLLSHFVTASASLYFFLSGRSQYNLKLRHLLPDFAVIRSISQVGFPAFIMNLTLGLVFAAYNHVLADFGPGAVAVLGIIFRVASVFVWIIFGIGHGVMPLVGFSYGAHLYGRLIEIVDKAVRVSALIGAVSSSCLILFAPQIIGMFVSDPALAGMAVPALRIHAASLVLLGPIIIWISMFNGLGKGFTSMSFLVMRDTVFLIPFMFLLPAALGLNGVWLSQPVSNVLVFSLLFFRARKEIRALAQG